MQVVNEQYHTVEDVAEKLQVSPRTVRRWIKEGRLGSVKFSPEQRAYVRITETDLREFIERHRRPPQEG